MLYSNKYVSSYLTSIKCEVEGKIKLLHLLTLPSTSHFIEVKYDDTYLLK